MDFENILEIISKLTGHIVEISKFENALCNKVYLVNAENGKYVLKMAQGKTRKQELSHEKQVMRFVENTILVPDVIMYNEQEELSFLLMKYISGITMQCCMSVNSNDRISAILNLGKSLAEIHKVDLKANYDYDKELSYQLEKAEDNMNHGLLDPEEFRINGKYIEPALLLQELCSNKHKGHNICLLHGDFRPKNVIISNAENYILDWGFSFIGDPYYDLAIVLYYFSEFEQKAFIEGYGIKEIDFQRLDYFDKLSKFLNV